jgi:hypothetical protein
MSTYTEAKRQAYLRNKDKIAEKEKEKKRWVTYYEQNKDEVSTRRKERRLKKELPPIDEEKVKRYYELMEEARALKAEVTRKKIRTVALAKRSARAPPPPPPPANPPGSEDKEDSPGDGLKPTLIEGIEDTPDNE